MSKRLGWLFLLTLATPAIYLLLWYLQAPVSTGVYPGRVGGIVWVEKRNYELPVIWVRPHPFARVPPSFEEVTLTDGVHRTGMGGRFLPELDWPNPRRPAWLQARVIPGSQRVPAGSENYTATEVEFKWPDEPMKRYPIGPVDLRHAPEETSPLISGWLYHPRYEGGPLEGIYIEVEARGRLVELIAGVPGMEGTPPEIYYTQYSSSQPTMIPYPPAPATEGLAPATLPLELSDRTLLYVPLTPQARERIRTTHLSPQIALVVQGVERLVAPIPGYRSDAAVTVPRTTQPSGWRGWMDYYILEPLP